MCGEKLATIANAIARWAKAAITAAGVGAAVCRRGGFAAHFHAMKW